MLPINIPDISEQDIQNAVDVMRSGWLTQGEQVKILEKRICDYTGARYAVVVSSGTAALHLALLALDIGPGDDVIVPAYTFVATANAVTLTGAKPVFVDIDIDTLCIDPDKIRGAITPRTKAIMPVHAFGLCAEMIVIKQIAKEHGLHVIEDAACAFGSQINGKSAGTFGDMGCFSFHGRKIITSGEGGVVVTNNIKLAFNIELRRSHGIYDLSCYMPGFNYRMTDIQAALLKDQILRIDQSIRLRRAIAAEYMSGISGTFQTEQPAYRHNGNAFHVIHKDAKRIRAALKKEGIQTTHGANYIPDEPYYKLMYGAYPNAYKAREYGFLLPIYKGVPTQKIISCINHTVQAKQ